MSSVASINHKWMTFRITRPFVGCLSWVTGDTNRHSVRPPSFLHGIHQSGLGGRVSRPNPLLNKRRLTVGSLPRHLKDAQIMRNKVWQRLNSLVWLPSGMFEWNQARIITRPIPLLKWSMVVAAGTGKLIRIKIKINAAMCKNILHQSIADYFCLMMVIQRNKMKLEW